MYRRDVADRMGGEHPGQPAGLIAQVAANRRVAVGDVAALTEEQIDDREDRVQPSTSWAAAGVSKSTSSSRSRPRARSIRFWTLASVVSNARAISAVLKPHSVRNAMATRDSAGTASWQQTKSKRSGSSPISPAKCGFERQEFPLGVFGKARQCLSVGSLPPQRVNCQVASGPVKPAGRVFRHTAPRPGFQGLHERSLNNILDEFEPAHTERPGQHGVEPAELVAKKVLHQRSWFVHA